MARERATVTLGMGEGEEQVLDLPLPAAKAVVRDALTALGKTYYSVKILIGAKDAAE